MSGYITFEERLEIESMIFQRSSFGKIAKKINKAVPLFQDKSEGILLLKKAVTAVSVLTLAYTRKPAKWVWCVAISVLKPLASCAEPADIVTTIALNLQSRFVS
jgi:hypothetical protein